MNNQPQYRVWFTGDIHHDCTRPRNKSAILTIGLRKGWALPAVWLLLIMLSSYLGVQTLGARTLEAQTPSPPFNSGASLPYDEAQAQAIDRQIMCPVCPAESIDQAQVPIARQMRQMVRNQLAQGASQKEILEFFAERYGPDILASPPKSGFNLVAWIFPLVAVAAALIAGWLVIRSMVTRRLVSPDSLDSPNSIQAQRSDLEPFLAMVDADIGLVPSANTSAHASIQGPPNVELAVDPEKRNVEDQRRTNEGG